MPARWPSLDEARAEQAKRRLIAFVEQAWSVNEPKRAFINNWHIGAVCEHLEAVTLKQLPPEKTILLINIPPGCMKSYLASVFWPCWEWIAHPDYRYLCASYDQELSTRDNVRARNILTSAWYQRHWPLAFSADQDTKTRFENVKHGWRIATSVGGRALGEHPHRKIIDDPHKVSGSLSEVLRREAKTWFALTMATRGAALDAMTVLFMQRLHQDDLSQHVLDTLGDQVIHICLPMRYEPRRMVETPLGFSDPRREPGQLLWPGLFTEARVRDTEAKIRSELGDYGVAGQMQQRPVPESGGLFKREWFAIVDAAPAEAFVVARARGWDGAGTEGGGDWTVGVRMCRTESDAIYIEDVVRAQVGPGDDEKLMRVTAELDPEGTRQIEEREGGSAGKKVIAAHAKALIGFDYVGESPTGSKLDRARPFAAQCRIGNVRLVKGEWNKVYIDELSLFPAGRHDDQVDASSTSFNAIGLEPYVGGDWSKFFASGRRANVAKGETPDLDKGIEPEADEEDVFDPKTRF